MVDPVLRKAIHSSKMIKLMCDAVTLTRIQVILQQTILALRSMMSDKIQSLDIYFLFELFFYIFFLFLAGLDRSIATFQPKITF